MAVTGAEPISAENLVALKGAGLLGGGVLLYSDQHGAVSVTTSRPVSDFDAVEVCFQYVDKNYGWTTPAMVKIVNPFDSGKYSVANPRGNGTLYLSFNGATATINNGTDVGVFISRITGFID